MITYDAIVIGLGAMGTATTRALAQRGQRVLGLDAFARGHTFGASHGRTRIIREAYFEAPEYVPLVQHAYDLWRELEQETGRSLLTITGGIVIGPPDGELVIGAQHSAQVHNLPHEVLSAPEIRQRFPGLNPLDDAIGVLEPNAGILHADACLAALADSALTAGADLRYEEPALAWSRDGDGVTVRTERETYHAQYLVLALGAWTDRLLPDLGVPLVVHRVVNAHFAPRQPGLYTPDICPVHIWTVPEGQFYGFPALPEQGLKIGRHDVDEPCTPETIRRDVSEQEIAALRHMLDRYLPGASGPTLWTLTCTYTHSPDEHFLVDTHPAHRGVAFGCGFSGHGFKFTPAIGEALAALALGETPPAGTDFFAVSRLTAARPA
jgi:sarcosine oxidase